MINGYLIERYNDMANSYTSTRLKAEAKKQNIKLDLFGVYDSNILDNKVYNKGLALEERDFSILRFKKGHIKRELGSLTKKQYNEIHLIDKYCDKYTQLRNLDLKEVISPKYILGQVDTDFEFIVLNLGLPFIAKGLDSEQGREVYLIKSKIDYEKLRRLYCENFKEIMFQQYIRESRGKDLRVFIIQGEVIGTMLRRSSTSFKANYSLGAAIENYEIDSSIRKVAREVYKKTDIFYIGLDLLFGRDGYVFCELNVNPGFKGIEKATKKNICEELIYRIKEDL